MSSNAHSDLVNLTEIIPSTRLINCFYSQSKSYMNSMVHANSPITSTSYTTIQQNNENDIENYNEKMNVLVKKDNTFKMMHSSMGDSNIENPQCLNSVYLDQGGYFLDDEFGISSDQNLNSNINDSIKYSLMTQSMNCESSSNAQIRSSSSLNIDQPHSDSCLFDHDQIMTKPDLTSHEPRCDRGDLKLKHHDGLQTSLSSYCTHSGSNSWMQMVMDQSFNPELRALINRTAAAVDYKIAYGDSIALQRKFANFNLAQTMAMDLSNQSNSSEPVLSEDFSNQNYSIGVSVDSESNGKVIDQSNTTTWAKKHGSRESLKKRIRSEFSNTPSNLVQFNDVTSKIVNIDKNESWNTVRQVNGALVTWNQLKRVVVRRTESLYNRESRKDYLDYYGMQQHEDDQSLDGLKQRISASAVESYFSSHRSYSQPVTNTNMNNRHRFSGTLLEIFMRARMSNILSTYAPTREVLKSNFLNKTDFTHPLNFTKLCPSSELSSMFVSQNGLLRSMHNFGAQFPPLEDYLLKLNNKTLMDKELPGCAPTWSSKSPLRNNVNPNSALLQYYQAVRRSHPLPLYSVRPHSVQTTTTTGCIASNKEEDCPSLQTGNLAACLTASVGPDSPYMAALRAGCIAQGYAVGWIGNPRSIAYPGLGLLSVPRPSRMGGHAFLSHTLPDLSFLGQAGAEEDRKGTPTMSKQQATCLCANRKSKSNRLCAQCGCRIVPAFNNPKFGSNCVCSKHDCHNRFHHHHRCQFERQNRHANQMKDLKMVAGKKPNFVSFILIIIISMYYSMIFTIDRLDLID